MRKTTSTLAFALLWAWCINGLAQTGVIKLKNPSFEDSPRHSQTPKDWIDCGFEGESEPDIQPNGEFGVTIEPQHGGAYLGMVVRDNETWERISTELSQPLQEGQCYKFSLFLARSPQYISLSRVTKNQVNYITPAKLRIYGGNTPCDAGLLLAESKLVVNYEWEEYLFVLSPKDNYSYIFFEVYYKTPVLFPYNGNILLDNASALIPISCEKREFEQSTIQTNVPDLLLEEEAKEETNIKLPPPIQFVKGELLPVKDIKFAVGRSDLQRSSYAKLDKLVEMLTIHPTLTVEISVHLNYKYDKEDAEDLSIQRAGQIEQYLLDKQVNKTKFKVIGLGNTHPLNIKELSTNDERVEIKIITF